MGDDDNGRRRGRRAGRVAPTLRERIRYRFDNLLARGTAATLIWLGAVTIAAVLVSSVLLRLAGVTFAGSEDGSWLEDAWQSLLRVMDPGTMAGDVGWGRRLLALLVTIFGLLVAGTLIGIIAAGVEESIDRMRRGRSVVIESDHVVVLGASDRLPVLLRQLVLAGAEGGSRTIVVLADLDPSEMHDMTRDAGFAKESGIDIIHRSGDPRVPDDLALTRLGTARAAIVLSDGQSDIAAVEVVLGIAAEYGGLDALTVVVELLEEQTAHALHRAYGASIHPIVTSQALGRITAFALRQRGLSQVVDELLDFRGSDLHLVQRPELTGTSFGALVRGFENARPIGLSRADGRLHLCPPLDTDVEAGDRIVMIADDVRRLEFSPSATRATVAPGPTPKSAIDVEAERLVVVGWSEIGVRVLEGWSLWTSPSSTLEILVDPRQVALESIAVPELGAISVTTTVTDDVVATAADRDATTVMFLAPPGAAADTDVRTILRAQALRRELRPTGVLPRLVVQLLDAGHETLIDLDGADDLVISDAMTSHFLVQLVDQPARRDVLLELYSDGEATLRLERCEQLGLAGPYAVRDLVDEVAARGLLVIGWRRSGHEGVTLNPRLGDHVDLDAADELVVVG